MAADLVFTNEEMAIDDGLGYPKAYAKLCRDPCFSPYRHGPPFTFIPHVLQQHEALRAEELEKMFPIIDPKAKPTAKPKIFSSLLWKQLNHLGNAGFDPDKFRIDPYGNVLYYHADTSSPLAWEIDHWFPCSRGGLTVPSNLRILQWQVCKRKHNKLEFLIPWWDLQVGISVNQFLSIFASSNSDFRHRAFSLLFSEGESEELNASQTVDSHNFPHHFIESKAKVGLAPAAVVTVRREAYNGSSTLKSLDINRRPRSNSPIIAARKSNPGILKENEIPDMVSNPYQAIIMARDSLRQREEATKMQAEIQKIDDEVNELNQMTEEEKVTIQELEAVLTKRRKRAEKCRRLAEAQSSYREMLEKMIRDAMHQGVIYKEQVRLNQAAATALKARLEAQKAICDAAEHELHRKMKQRDELEKQIRSEWEHTRKRSRMDDCLSEEKDDKMVLYLPESKPETQFQEVSDTQEKPYLPNINSRSALHAKLSVFLEEEKKGSKASLPLNEDLLQEEIEEEAKETVLNISKGEAEEHKKAIIIQKDEYPIVDKLKKLKIKDEGKKRNIQFPLHESESEKDEESRKQRGKGNVEKWLQMLLENSQENTDPNPQKANEVEGSRTDEVIRRLNLIYPHKDVKILRSPESQDNNGLQQIHDVNNQRKELNQKNREKKEERIVETVRFTLPNNRQNTSENECWKRKEQVKMEAIDTPSKKHPSEKGNTSGIVSVCKGLEINSKSEGQDERGNFGREKGPVRSGSERALQHIASSPSVVLGMGKSVDYREKKHLGIGYDNGDEDHTTGNSLKSSLKTIKKAVEI